jgi:hypothetical protein
MPVLISSTNLYETFIILRRNQRKIIINVRRSLCKASFILVRFWWNLDFLDTISKNSEISNWVKIGPEGTELFQAYRRTDGQNEDISRFSQFCERC